MADPARRLATYEDLLDLPEHLTGEVIDGEVVALPRARSRHGRFQGTLAHWVGGPFDFDDEGPGGWWFASEPLIDLGPHQLLSPDVAGWRREVVPEFPDGTPVRVRPDWVCEILSPSTARLDRGRKADLYLQAGVGWMWLVDLDLRTIEAWEARDGAWVRLGAWDDRATARIPPFDAVALELARLFR